MNRDRKKHKFLSYPCFFMKQGFIVEHVNPWQIPDLVYFLVFIRQLE